MNTTFGKYVWVEQENYYFQDVTDMLLEYCDTPEFEGTTIVAGTPVRHSMKAIRARHPDRKIIVYQLEQMVGTEAWFVVKDVIKNMEGADELWEYDPINRAYLKEYYGIEVTKMFPFRYTKSLDKELYKEQPKDIDVLFYGFLNSNRAKTLSNIQFKLYKDTIRIVTLFGFLGNVLDSYLKRAKIVLNIHAFQPYSRQECPRIFYLLCNGICVLSEKTQHNHFPGMIVEAEKSDLPEQILALLKDDSYKNFGIQAREEFMKLW